MRFRPLWLVPAVALALLAPRPARAEEDEKDEKPVAAADVPKPVADAVAKKYPKATVTKWTREEEKGKDEKEKKVFYEASLEIKSKDKDGKETVRKVDVLLTEAGKIAEEEEVVAADTLPDAVKKAIEASKYAKAGVKRVERTVKDEDEKTATFEIVFDVDGKRWEVTFDASGKILEEEGPEGDK